MNIKRDIICPLLSTTNHLNRSAARVFAIVFHHFHLLPNLMVNNQWPISKQCPINVRTHLAHKNTLTHFCGVGQLVLHYNCFSYPSTLYRAPGTLPIASGYFPAPSYCVRYRRCSVFWLPSFLPWLVPAYFTTLIECGLRVYATAGHLLIRLHTDSLLRRSH